MIIHRDTCKVRGGYGRSVQSRHPPLARWSGKEAQAREDARRAEGAGRREGALTERWGSGLVSEHRKEG